MQFNVNKLTSFWVLCMVFFLEGGNIYDLDFLWYTSGLFSLFTGIW